MNAKPRHHRSLVAMVILVCINLVNHSVFAQGATSGEPSADTKSEESKQWDTTEHNAVPIAEGKASREWIAQQASRKQASTTKQTLSGPIMGKVHGRYLESFTRPVPDRLRDDLSTDGK
jgi:hypothetical protein